MRVKFWGTRGSIAVPGKNTIIYGGNTTCLDVTLRNGRKVIIDAGTGIRSLGEQLISENDYVDIHLLITHIHWDHILGFPFFPPIYNPSSVIWVDGHATCMKGLRYAFDNNMGDGFFPIKFDDLKAQIRYIEKVRDHVLEIDGTLIDSIPLQHPQGGLGFRFREGDKTLVFLTDNELRDDAWIGRGPGEYAKFCEDADVLIHDCQYTPQEIEYRQGWGHSDYESLVQMACKANVKRLILFHHDPSRKDSEVTAIEHRCEYLARKLNSNMIIEAAKEDGVIKI